MCDSFRLSNRGTRAIYNSFFRRECESLAVAFGLLAERTHTNVLQIRFQAGAYVNYPHCWPGMVFVQGGIVPGQQASEYAIHTECPADSEKTRAQLQ